MISRGSKVARCHNSMTTPCDVRDAWPPFCMSSKLHLDLPIGWVSFNLRFEGRCGLFAMIWHELRRMSLWMHEFGPFFSFLILQKKEWKIFLETITGLPTNIFLPLSSGRQRDSWVLLPRHRTVTMKLKIRSRIHIQSAKREDSSLPSNKTYLPLTGIKHHV